MALIITLDSFGVSREIEAIDIFYSFKSLLILGERPDQNMVGPLYFICIPYTINGLTVRKGLIKETCLEGLYAYLSL